MRATLALAEQALEQGELPIAATVVLDGEVIASASTAERRERRLLVHAELLALERADRLSPYPGRREDTILYTNLEPCLMCMGAAMSFRVGTICYGLESPSDGAVAIARAWQRDVAAMPAYRLPEIVAGLLREESRALFGRYVTMHASGPAWEWARSLAEIPPRSPLEG